MTYAKREPFVPEPETVIWRYLDDFKFEDLLCTFCEHTRWEPDKPGVRVVHHNDPGQLWFGHPYSFGDEKEGQYPDANQSPDTYLDRMAERNGLTPEEAAERKERFLAKHTVALHDSIFFMAQLCGVSCWHANDCESVAMWDDFVSSRNGVAIRSTCKDVERAITHAHNSPAKQASPALCAVGYVDYSNYFLPQDGYQGLLSIVQEIHSHENEVRFFAKSPELAAIPMSISSPMLLDPSSWPSLREGLKEKVPDFIEECNEKAKSAYLTVRQTDSKGFRLPVSLGDLFDEVVLKPGCESAYEHTVRKMLENAGINEKRVRKSTFD